MNRWLAWCGLLVLAGALGLRLPGLERRPLHNDEAINAIKLQGLWEQGAYRYDPREYHGPSLYYTALPVLWLVHSRDFDHLTEATLRLVPVCFGAALILLLWLVADGLGRAATLAAALLLAISPAMVFYSRYFIHEMLLVCSTMALLGCGWRYWQTRHLDWALLAGVSLGLMYATKETFVLNVFALVGAGLVTWLTVARTSKSAVSRVSKPADCCASHAEPTWKSAIRQVWKPALQVKPLLAALAAAAVVSLPLFSSFFTNPAGPLDSIRTYLPWLRRAGGHSLHNHPWYFYLERVAWFHPARGPVWSEGLILVLAAAGLVAAITRKGLAGANPGFVRYLGAYTLTLTAVYSAIAYKTPWCLLNFWLGMILLAGVGARALFTWARFRLLQGLLACALLAGAGHLGWQAWRATHAFEADRRNPYVYAHTTPNLLELVRKVQALAAVSPEKNDLTIKVFSRESYWPLPWYLRQFKRVGWYDRLPHNPYAPIVISEYRLGAALDEKSNQAWLMPGLFELRPGVFLELYVQFGLWKKYVESLPPVRDD